MIVAASVRTKENHYGGRVDHGLRFHIVESRGGRKAYLLTGVLEGFQSVLYLGMKA